MKVLDLFCGLKGRSEPFTLAGHQVVTVDIEERFNATITADIRTVSAKRIIEAFDGYPPDLVLASPPCEGFSVMNIGKNWNRDHSPKTDTARLALELVEKTVTLIRELEPKFFVIENPRAKLRRIMEFRYPEMERRTVTYCQLGERRMKPTDLWSSRWPETLTLPAPCTNGAPCHVSAPRGSTTGTQGMDRTISAKIPYQLADLVRVAVEREME